MATMNVSLPSPMKDWAEQQAKGGRYSNVSDYVRDLIRKDQDRLAKIVQMQKAVAEGLESGAVTDTMSDVVAEARIQHSAKTR